MGDTIADAVVVFTVVCLVLYGVLFIRIVFSPGDTPPVVALRPRSGSIDNRVLVDLIVGFLVLGFVLGVATGWLR